VSYLNMGLQKIRKSPPVSLPAFSTRGGLIFFALKNWYMIGTLTKIFEGRKIAVSKNWYINWYINEMPKPAKPVKSRFTRKER